MLSSGVQAAFSKTMERRDYPRYAERGADQIQVVTWTGIFPCESDRESI